MPATRKKGTRKGKTSAASRGKRPSPRRAVAAGGERREKEAPHVPSPTAVAAEVLRTGVAPQPAQKRREGSSKESEKLRVGDPDDDALRNEYSGEDTPGGSTPTPDQNDVDEIGRVYGLQEEDSGALRSASEVLSRRDRRRQELKAPRRPQP